MTKIDSFYKVADKSNYYLGMISQVNRAYSTIQIENLSLFSYRKLRTDILAPNTINFYVLIDDKERLEQIKLAENSKEVMAVIEDVGKIITTMEE